MLFGRSTSLCFSSNSVALLWTTSTDLQLPTILGFNLARVRLYFRCYWMEFRRYVRPPGGRYLVIKVFYHVSQEIYISAAINFVIRLPSSAIHNYLSDNSSFLSSRPCCRAFLVALPGEQPLQNYLYQHL